MGRRWRMVILLLALGGVGVAIALNERRNEHRPGAPPFTDIDTALVPETTNGWKLSIPPPQPGPYRLLPGGPVSGVGSGLQAHIRDKSGQVIEELKLEPIPGYDQAIVILETPSGRQTMAALKRAK